MSVSVTVKIGDRRVTHLGHQKTSRIILPFLVFFILPDFLVSLVSKYKKGRTGKISIFLFAPFYTTNIIPTKNINVARGKYKPLADMEIGGLL